MPYKFELENVLNFRNHVEDSLKAEYAGIEQTMENEKKLFEEKKNKQKKQIASMQRKMKTGLLSSECIAYSAYIETSSQNLKSGKERILEIKRKLDEKRDDLIKAVKNRKILEKLKSKRRQTYKTTQEKIELSQLDEFALNKHTRRLESE